MRYILCALLVCAAVALLAHAVYGPDLKEAEKALAFACGYAQAKGIIDSDGSCSAYRIAAVKHGLKSAEGQP